MGEHDDGLGRDEFRHAPRKASRSAVAVRLNRLAEITNFLHEQLSELRHDLRLPVTEPYDAPRSSLPVRYMEPVDREG